MKKPRSKPRPWNIARPAIPEKPMQRRVRTEFYHTSRWKKESKQFRMENPLCTRHQARGFIVPSEVTDHKIPLEICEDPWDHENWDALCKKCNNSKAAEDKKLIKQHREKKNGKN